ncbi:SLAM family member 5-like [Puntigrus tetrazona]|uniref:SLAM family member 5-like n=1 Tax=Puntigrus tetrazona TaxID=1606681 RepID=UPI001C8979C3|nr:SLAM family member 5-like [Puntigrus tetrazona]
MFHMFVLLCLCWWHPIGVFGESMSVTEGDSVTLYTDFTEIHEDDDVLWKFGAEDSLIAEISREDRIFSTFNVPDGRFRDRLKLDNQTGSLTIMNISTQHAGVYELQLSGDTSSSKTFSVSVYASLPTPNIRRDVLQNLSSSSSSQQNCSLLCSAVNVGHVTLSWYKGNSLLSSISVSDLNISLSLPLEVEYQDKNTYSCVINNPIRNQTTHLDFSTLCPGVSAVKLIYLAGLKNKLVHLSLCHQTVRIIFSITDQGVPLLYMISAAGSLLIVAAVVTCCICKKCRKKGQKLINLL